jgi:hypothetical protein
VATPKYVFKRTPQFRKSFDGLTAQQKEQALEAFKKFKLSPFDPSFRVHKINRLTSIYRRMVLSATISGNLRAVFTVHENQIISLDIGTHDIYG